MFKFTQKISSFGDKTRTANALAVRKTISLGQGRKELRRTLVKQSIVLLVSNFDSVKKEYFFELLRLTSELQNIS